MSSVCIECIVHPETFSMSWMFWCWNSDVPDIDKTTYWVKYRLADWYLTDSSPITKPPGSSILVHWGQKNPEIKIETNIHQFWSVLTCSWRENRISEGTAGFSDGKSKTPEKIIIRRSGDQEVLLRGLTYWVTVLSCGGVEGQDL